MRSDVGGMFRVIASRFAHADEPVHLEVVGEDQLQRM